MCKAQQSKISNMQINSKLNSSLLSYKKEITSIGVEVIETLSVIKKNTKDNKPAIDYIDEIKLYFCGVKI